jgi:predicted transcriptional regulator
MSHPLQENPSPGRVHVGAFVDREQRRQLVELARREDRSVSSVIRQALATYVQRKDKP